MIINMLFISSVFKWVRNRSWAAV